MIVIKIEPLEKADLIRILEYAKEKKKQEKISDKLLEYELEKINGLISRINGKEINLELDRKMGGYISFIK